MRTRAARQRAALSALSRTYDLLQTYGWLQGTMGSKVEGFCLMGALRCANGVGEEDAERVLWKTIQATISLGVVNPGITYWNDRHGRTKRQVLGVIRKAKHQVKEMVK